MGEIVPKFVKNKYRGLYFENEQKFILNDEGMKVMNMICIDILDAISEVKFH